MVITVRGTLKAPVDGVTYFLEFEPMPKQYDLLADIQVGFGENKLLHERAKQLVGKTVTVTGTVVETVPSRGFPKDWILIMIVEATAVEGVTPR
jgi:hypothetical protein